MHCNFSFKHYRECLEKAKKLGFRFFLFRELEKSKEAERVVFMRHDVDKSVKNALKFAEIEKETGVKATYFIRVHAPYNPFSLENYVILKKIIKLGHEIALHYSPDFRLIAQEGMLALFKREKAVLESITGEKVLGISTHEPGNTPIEINDSMLEKLGLHYHAYSPKFVKEMRYISESSGRWREGCMCASFEKEKKLVILVHPCWWFEKTPLENY
jgi:hypothetical protein